MMKVMQVSALDVLVRAEVAPNTPAADCLLALAKAPIGLEGEFSFAFHLTTADAGLLPIGITMNDRGPLDGAAFRAAAANAKILVNFAKSDAGQHTADLKECMASGAFVLAENSPVAQALGLVTFATPQELLAKVYQHLRDETPRS